MKLIDAFPATVLAAVVICALAYPKPARRHHRPANLEASLVESTRNALYQDDRLQGAASASRPERGPSRRVRDMMLLRQMQSSNEAARMKAVSALLIELHTERDLGAEQESRFLRVLLSSYGNDPSPRVRSLIGVFLPHIFESWQQSRSAEFVDGVRACALPYLEMAQGHPDRFTQARSTAALASLCRWGDCPR